MRPTDYYEYLDCSQEKVELLEHFIKDLRCPWLVLDEETHSINEIRKQRNGPKLAQAPDLRTFSLND